MRNVGDAESEGKEGHKNGFPEADDFHVAEQREVIQVALLREGDGPAQNVAPKSHIGIGEEEPLSGGGFIGFLQRVRFAEPAGRKLGDVHNAEPRVDGREFVEDAAGGVERAVVDGDHFEVGIIELHECGEGGREFFFLVARGEEKGNSRAIGIRRRREILYPRQANRAIGDAESMSNPEKCDGSEENESQKVHGDWCRTLASGYPNTRCGEA